MLLLLSQREIYWKDAEVTRSKEVLNNQPAGDGERSPVRGGEAKAFSGLRVPGALSLSPYGDQLPHAPHVSVLSSAPSRAHPAS